MSDRTVKVTLQAQVSNYLSGMEQARKATEKGGKEAASAQASFEAQRQAMEAAGVSLLAIGTLAAAGVALAVKKYAEFDSAMSEVQASTHESEANMNKLRDAAIDAGARTVFSATEAANAIDELAKAGLSTADILGGALDGALSLASAGGLKVADAAQIAATALTQFKLEGKDVPHVADLLAAGAGKAQGSVEDLSQALNQGGLVASQAGFSIEETTGVLAAFASAGLKGSDAGTSLKTAIIALQAPSAKAQALMDEYGISVYDSNGKMKSFSEIAGVLQKSLGGMEDEQRNATLATIFGTDAVRSASVLYSNGSKGIDSWNKKVNDSGYAAETARLKLNNLNGDLEQLGGSFDTALIKSGSAANEVLRGLVQSATGAVNAFGEAPPVVQGTALALGAVAAATALAGGAFLIGVPKLAQFHAGLATLSQSSMPSVAAGAMRVEGAVAKAGTALSKVGSFVAGPWGIALAAGAIGVDQLFKAIEAGQTTSKEFENTLRNTSSALDILRAAGRSDDVTKSLFGDYTDSLKKLPELLDKAKGAQHNFFAELGLTANELGAVDGLDRLGESVADLAASDLPAAQRAFRTLATEYKLTKDQQATLLEAMPAYKEALTAQANTLGINVTSSNEARNATNLLKLAYGDATPTAIEAADAYLKTADSADETNDAVRRLIDSMQAANDKNQDAISANADYQKALEDVRDTIADIDPATGQARSGIEAFKHTLDESTEAGSANVAMLADLAAKGQDAAFAQLDAGGSTDQYTAALQANYKAVYDTAFAIDGNAEAAKRLADRVAGMPTQKQLDLIVQTAQANDALDNFITRWDGKQVHVPLILTGDAKSNAFKVAIGAFQANGSVLDFYANGGMRENHVAQIAPAGSMRVWAEPETGGEAYIPLAASKRARSLEIWQQTGNRLGVPGYARGAIVQPQYARSSYSGGGGGSSAPVSVQIVSKGIDLSDYLEVVVDGKIQTNNRDMSGALIRGKRQR